MTWVTDCASSAQACVESPQSASVVSPSRTSKQSALGLDFLHTLKRSLWPNRRSILAEAAYSHGVSLRTHQVPRKGER